MDEYESVLQKGGLMLGYNKDLTNAIRENDTEQLMPIYNNHHIIVKTRNYDFGLLISIDTEKRIAKVMDRWYQNENDILVEKDNPTMVNEYSLDEIEVYGLIHDNTIKRT